MQTSVHIRVGSGGQVFGVVLMDGGDISVFLDCRRVHLEGFVVLPELLGVLLNVDQEIALGRLVLSSCRTERQGDTKQRGQKQKLG
jgi:hypothetical protein